MMRRIAAALAVVMLTACGAAAQTPLPATIDALVEAPINAGSVAGASVAVARGTQVLVDRGWIRRSAIGRAHAGARDLRDRLRHQAIHGGSHSPAGRREEARGRQGDEPAPGQRRHERKADPRALAGAGRDTGVLITPARRDS
jgi:hypothetical protein